MKQRYRCRMCGRITEKNPVLIEYGGAVWKVGALCCDCYLMIGIRFVDENNYRKENRRAD
jgi:ribosome-binding protein aMBF1 (putative translation factor)